MTHPLERSRARALAQRPELAWLLGLFVVIAAGVTRSWITTSLDSLQIDEAWHSVAGISYARTGDFRLNPEHPPLVKLWVGAFMPERLFKLRAFRVMEDKEGEREFIDDAFYSDNDPIATHRHLRWTMLGFHALLLVALGLTLRRVFGPALALVTVTLLVLDPTVAAHMPVVLTDLPVALLSTIAVLWAFSAFSSTRVFDVIVASLSLGLALSAKHSAIPVGLAVAALGLAMTARGLNQRGRWLHLARVAVVLLGAYATLWAGYGFRFSEIPAGTPTASVSPSFNRSIADKVEDLTSPLHRQAIQVALDHRLLPRAYLWGLADIVRAGVEGRQDVMHVYGKLVYADTPWYFFPAVLSAKLPIGLQLLAAVGLIMLLMRRLDARLQAPLYVLLFWGAFHMYFIMTGNSGYAGVRHAIPVYPVFAALAALPLISLPRWPWAGRLLVGASFVFFCVSALPNMRPWGYYNELVGGPDDAWRYFSDDGLENGQRGREIGEYYRKHLVGRAEPVYDFYGLYDKEKTAYGLQFRAFEDDPLDLDVVTGTAFVNTRWLSERPLYDYRAFRETRPIARFGNVLVVRGSFRIPWIRAERRSKPLSEALSPEHRDPARALQLAQEIVEIYPEDSSSSFLLGNMLVERGRWSEAQRAYELARHHLPEGEKLADTLALQIVALTSDPRSVKPLRNPWLE